MTTPTLTHHGVKGMKWGVRKKARFVDRTKRKKNLGDKLQTEQMRVRKKGEKVYHVTTNPRLKPRAGGLYVAYRKDDADMYKNLYSIELKAARKAEKAFQYDLEVTEDLITPTKKRKVDEFIDMYRGESSAKLIDKMAKDKMRASTLLKIARTIGLGKNQKEKVTEKYRESIFSDNPKKQRLAFDSFMQFLDKNPKSRTEYINRLAKSGFTAMYDDLDIAWMYTNEPLIVFNPEKSLRITGKRET